jgi:hypothetical protein
MLNLIGTLPDPPAVLRLPGAHRTCTAKSLVRAANSGISRSAPTIRACWTSA